MEHVAINRRPMPVVLTGGKSRRFGRDKLREPLGDGIMVDAPLRALRDVFGAPIAVAGACHDDVKARAEIVIVEREADAGPIAGIAAALEHPLAHPPTGVFVLAGDLPFITAAEVLAIWSEAERRPDAWAVLGNTGRVEPCIGVYRPAALAVLRERMRMGRRGLHDALPADRVVMTPIDAARARNVNETGDLPRVNNEPS